jgi:two-component system, chemotaxis family, CheB/CheR fusion protein
MNKINPHSSAEIDALKKALHDMSERLVVFESISQDAMICIAPDGVIIAWNPAAEKMLGYKAVEIIGQSIQLLANSEGHAQQKEYLARSSQGEILEPIDSVKLHKNGSLVQVSVTARPLRALDGSIFGRALVMQDISRRKEWERRQKLMTRELSHRVKNSFAVLQAILHSTLKTTPQPEEFAKVFSSRLHSLAAAQDVLTANDWKGVELGALARHQLASYDRLDDVKLTVTGPEIYLPPSYASPFGLIFNELAANALKHGAWSGPVGKVELSWRVEHGKDTTSKLFVSWQERGGPKPATHRKPGLGIVLIEKSLAGAQVLNSYEAHGLTCTIELEIEPHAHMEQVEI